MAGRGNYNGPDQGSPYWNSQSEPEIDLWDPASASTGSYATAASNRNTAAEPNYTPNDLSASNVTQSAYNAHAANYQQTNNSNTYDCGDMPSSNWQSNVMLNPSMPLQNSSSQMPIYRHPNSTYGQSPNEGQFSNYPAQSPSQSSQSYGQYNPNHGTTVTTPSSFNSNMQPNYPQSQQSYTSVARNPIQSVQNSDWPADSWRSQSNASYNRDSNYSEPGERTFSTKPFQNPLMNTNCDGNAADNTADLIKQLHIQGQLAQQQVNNVQRTPSVLSKASLAMLKMDLKQAAVAFESAENLELARNIHLGLVDVADDVGQRVVISNLSASALDFVPRAPPVVSEHVPQQASQEQEDSLMENLNIFIDNVLKQPGNFDELVSMLLQQVKFYLHSDETVNKIVELIFAKAIDEDNFKYLGARLCDALTMPDVLSNFRSLFLNHFQSQFKGIQELIDKKSEDDKKIHGFFMFMAEIYIHLKINGTPIIAVGRSLSKSLEKLLSDFKAANVTFVCKVLKLTGGKLIDAFHTNEKDMENYRKLFTILKRFSDEKKDQADEGSKRLVLLISSVCQLKESNWGRTKSNSRKKSSIDDPEQYGDELSEVDQNYYMNEPVFFTPDGVQYTAAEAQIPDFYRQHLAKLDLSHLPSEDGASIPWSRSDQQGFDDFVPSDEEDELYREDSQELEYNSEFEKFLAESGQL